jgi:endonuclease YncB( thermonuclease family)
VRLLQIDTPELYFGVECYGRQAPAVTKRLLPTGTRVNLLPEPATDRIDQYGRLLRYVVRVSNGLNVNIRLVGRCRRALLLQRSSGPLRQPTGGAGEAGAREEARPLEGVSAHGV